MKTVLVLVALSIGALSATSVLAQEQTNKDGSTQSSASQQADNSAQDSQSDNDTNSNASEGNKSVTEKVTDSVKDAGGKAKDGAKWLINDPHVDGKGKAAQQ